MGKFTVTGLDEVSEAFRASSDVPDDVKENILKAMAEVAMEKIRETGRRMGVFDPSSSVHVIESQQLSKPKLTDSGGSIDISFSGSRTRGKSKTRNAEIAFINEFGKRGQPARPFIKNALDKHADEINEAAQKVLDKWHDSLGG